MSEKFVYVFTAECSEHGRQVVAVTDYDPENANVMVASDERLWELLEQYLQPMVGALGLSMRELLDQYASDGFYVDRLPVLTL